MPTAPTLALTPRERRRLLRELHQGTLPPRVGLRIRIVLEASKGVSDRQIARTLRTSAVTAGLWRRRYAKAGYRGLRQPALPASDARRLPETVIRRIVKTTVNTRLPGGGRWTSRRLAEHLNVSHSTVQRVWRLYHLKHEATDPPKTDRPGSTGST